MARILRVDVEFAETDEVGVRADTSGDYITITDRWGNLAVSIHKDHFRVIRDALTKEIRNALEKEEARV